MNSTQVRAILSIVDLGSVTAAAGQLGYTPSAVSRMVEAVEGELGFALFTRSRQGMELTTNGSRILPAIRELGHWESQVTQLASEICGVVTGDLTISSYYCVAATWLPQILHEFGRRYPGVRVDVVGGGNSELAGDLQARRVDLGIVSRRDAENAGEDFVLLYTDQYVVWLPPDHELGKLEAIPPSALEGVPFVMPLPGTDNDVESYLSAHNVSVDIRFTSRDADTLYAMVEAGLGVSMNNALTSTRLRGNVVERPLDPPYISELGIALPALAEASPAALRFIEVAQEVAATWQSPGGTSLLLVSPHGHKTDD